MNDLHTAAVRLREFLEQATYLKHPTVDYYGTQKGDSPEKWRSRLYLAAITYAMGSTSEDELK